MKRRTLFITLSLVVVTCIVLIEAVMYYHQGEVREEHFLLKGSPIGELLKDKPATIMVYSPAFENNTRIPDKYTCIGLDVSPPLRILNLPGNTESLVIIMADPDAPSGVFYHWLLYSIPKNITELPENIPKTKITKYGYQGLNSFNEIGYNGPCPPKGHGTHHYYIIVIALDTKPDIPSGASISELLNEIKDHIVAYGYTIGTYNR